MRLVTLLALLACTPKPGPAGDDSGGGDDTAVDSGDTAEDTDTGGDTDSGGDSGEDTDSGEDSGGDSGGDSDTATGADQDGDGFDAPEDCDDGDPAVFPGATEVCDNGIDDDCDGTPGECGWSGDTRTSDVGFVIAGVFADEGAGGAVAADGDMDGDGNADVLVGASGREDSAGAIYVFRGPFSADLDVEDADATRIGETATGRVGVDVAWAGDVDGDGNDDVLVGGPSAPPGSGASGVGHAWLLHGPLTGEETLDEGDAFELDDRDAHLGSAVAGLGDMDGDGLDDVAIGAREDSSYLEIAGATYVLYGPVDPSADLDRADARIFGDVSDYGGGVAGGGDLNGDGVGDLVTSAPYHHVDGVGYPGAVYVYFGPLPSVGLASDADSVLVGHDDGGRLGHWADSVAIAGDLDGDGVADLALGAPEEGTSGHDVHGAVYVVTADQLDAEVDLFTATAHIEGTGRDDSVGASVAGAGDTDGDGFDDLLIGAPGWDHYRTGGGAVFLFRGPVSGTMDADEAAAAFHADDVTAALGYDVCAPADLTGDGMDDLLLGAPWGGGDWQGEAWIVPARGY